MINRRKFLTGVAASFAAGNLIVHRVGAEDAPMVKEDDPTAQALGYVADASKADPALFKEGSNCANCQLYQGGDGAGACAIFPGKKVAAAGWCKSWVAKG